MNTDEKELLLALIKQISRLADAVEAIALKTDPEYQPQDIKLILRRKP